MGLVPAETVVHHTHGVWVSRPGGLEEPGLGLTQSWLLPWAHISLGKLHNLCLVVTLILKPKGGWVVTAVVSGTHI